MSAPVCVTARSRSCRALLPGGFQAATSGSFSSSTPFVLDRPARFARQPYTYDVVRRGSSVAVGAFLSIDSYGAGAGAGGRGRRLRWCRSRCCRLGAGAAGMGRCAGSAPGLRAPPMTDPGPRWPRMPSTSAPTMNTRRLSQSRAKARSRRCARRRGLTASPPPNALAMSPPLPSDRITRSAPGNEDVKKRGQVCTHLVGLSVEEKKSLYRAR